MRDLRVPGGGLRAFGIRRHRPAPRARWLFTAWRRMRERGIGPMAAGVGHPGERWLIDVLDRQSQPEVALERLIARYPTPGLLRLADVSRTAWG